MIAETIIALIGTVVGGIISSIYTGYNNGRKDKINASLAQNEQAIELYKDMLKRTDRAIDELGKDVDELQKNYMLCREDNILKGEKNKTLEEKIKVQIEEKKILEEKIRKMLEK